MNYKRLFSFMLIFCFLTSILSSMTLVRAAENTEIQPEVYDGLRLKIVEWIVPSNYDENDPDIKAKIAAADVSAAKVYANLNKTTDRTNIFTTYPTKMPNINIQNTYKDLEKLTIAYSTKGSEFYKNVTMKQDIISALEWLYANWYNDKITLPTGPQTPDNNWFCYEIGAAWPLADITAILYDELTLDQIKKYMDTVELMCPEPTFGGHTVTNSIKDIKPAAWGSSGANRAWKLMAILVRAAVVQDKAKLDQMNPWMKDLFTTVSAGDGFYEDGSFIQHGVHPYTAGYGWGNLCNGIDLLVLLTGTPWEYTNANKSNVFSWIFNGFAPLIYKNRIFDNVSGREISRTNWAGPASSLIGAMINILPAASVEDQTKMKSMIKNTIVADEYGYMTRGNIRQIVKAKEIVNDVNIESKSIGNLYKQYPNMDRVAFQRKNFAFGVGMNSGRIANYEAINNENLKGWNTSNGRTTILDSDRSQHLDDFWATVDYDRLPGTTTNNGYSATLNSNGTTSDQGKTNNKYWVGGTDMNGLYGVTGMELSPVAQNLTGRKSWFMFDDEIVCLGAGITSTDEKVVETTVENRKINAQGNNKFIVNGQEQPTSLGWEENLENVNSVYLQGNVKGSDIGYYFPEGSSLKAIRGERTGSWDEVNRGGSKDLVTKNYLTLWFNHGVNPVDQKYSYVLLPGKSAEDTKAYASKADITVIENSKDAQAVRENKLNALAVNFWEDAVKTVDMVTSNKKASVFIKETPGKELELSVSDPTMLNNNYIDLELSRSAYSVISKDTNITVMDAYPNVKLRVNVAGAKGESFKIKLNLDKHKIIKSDNTTLRFDVTPNLNNINGFVGFASEDKNGLTKNDLQLGIKLNDQGYFEAKNGDTYDALTQIPYEAGKKYTVEMELNSTTGKYDAYVKPAATISKETLNDDLASLTKTFDKSPNWQKEGGATRYKRNKSSEEYLTYNVENIEDFTVKLLYNMDTASGITIPILDRAKFLVSSDNITYTQVAVDAVIGDGLNGGLNKAATITPVSKMPAGINYIKVVFTTADTAIWSPQIDDVTIIGTNEKLVDYKRIKLADDYATLNGVKAKHISFAGIFSKVEFDLSISNLIVNSEKLGTSLVAFEPENNIKNEKVNYNSNSILNIYNMILVNSIDNARFMLDSAVEGSVILQYKVGSRAILLRKVISFEAILNNKNTSESKIIHAIKALAVAVDEFQLGRVE
jgi:hyaluronate lyase